MRSPERRERTFLSNMFRTICLYMIIALCSFFTYIMLYGDVTFKPTLPGNVDASEDSNMNKLMEAFTMANNVTGDMTISVTSDDFDVEVGIDAKINMKNFDFDVNLETEIDGKSYKINAFKNSELDNFLHLSVNDMSFKFDMNEITLGTIDFSSILSKFEGLSEIAELLDAIGTAIGVDLSDLDLNSLMSKIEINENVAENGYRFTIYFGNLRLTLDVSEDFKDMTATVRELTMNNYKINIEVNSIKLDIPNFDIDNIPTNDEVDISSLVKIIENAKIDDNSYGISGDIVVKYGDIELAGNVGAKLVELDEKIMPFVRFKTNLNGIDAYIYYIDNTVYLSVEQLNLKINLNDNFAEIESILNEFDINFDIEALMAVSVIMPTFENLNFVVLEDGFELSLGDKIIFDDTISVENTKLVFKTKTIDENILPDMFSLDTTLSMDGTSEKVCVEVTNIMIGSDTQYLSDMELSENVATSLNTKYGMTDVQSFVDLANLLEIFKEGIKANNLTFNVDVQITDMVKVNGLVKFDINSMSFNLDANIDIDGLKLNIFLYGEDMLNSKVVYATIGEKSLKLDLAKANLAELLAEFGVSVDTSNMLEEVSAELGVDFENIDILDILKNIKLTESEEGSVITYNITLKDNTVKLTYNKELRTLGLTIAKKISGYDVKLNVSELQINADDFALTVPNGEEEDITPIFDIVEKAKIENGYALSSVVEITVNDKTYQARLVAQALKNGNSYLPYIGINTEIEGIKVYAYLVEEELYLNIENLLLAIDINKLNIEELTSILQEEFGLDTEAIGAVTVVLPALADISIYGLENGFNVSIDKEIVVNDNIKLSNSDFDIVTYNENGTMVLDYIQISTLIAMDENEYSVAIKLDSSILGEEAENPFIFTEGKVSALLTNNGTSLIESFVRAENLLEIFKEGIKANNLTFNVDVQINDMVKVNGLVKFDINSMSFNLDANIDIDGLKLNIFLYGEDMLNSKVIYATIGEKSLKLDLAKANLAELLAEFGVSADTSNMLEEVSAELGVDFENIDILDILKNIKLTESEEGSVITYNITLKDNTVKLTYNKELRTLGLTIAKKISGYDVKLNVSELQINADDFALTVPNGEEEDITPIFDIVEKAKIENGYALSSVVEITVNDKTYQARLVAQALKNGNSYLPYIGINTEIEGIKVYAYLVEEELYLNIENLLLAIDINKLNIEELTSILQEEFGLDTEAIGAVTVVLPALADISIYGLENGFNVSIDKEIVVNDNIKLSNSDFDIVTYNENGTMVLDYIQISTLIAMDENEYSVAIKLDSSILGEEAENPFIFTEGKVSALLTNNGTSLIESFVRAENLLEIFKEGIKANNLTFNVDVQITDMVKVNGLVKFDINSMSFNLDANIDIDGLKLNIFLYGEDMLNSKVVYATIGEKSLKLDLAKANLAELLAEFGVSVDTSNMLEEVSAELGVDFENIDILDILKNIKLTESEEGSVITYNITLKDNTVKLTYNKELRTLGLTLVKNISGYDVNLNISELQINADDFALTKPNGQEEDVTPIFDVVENVKVDDYTYAISGDLAVRYSTTSFYGDMLAMLVRKGEEYVPYVRIYTSAMNIETYIYLLDQDIYLDLHGLRLTFNLTEETIDEILTFVSEDLKMTISGLSNLTSTFNVILPALNSISANWIDGGVQINTGDLQYTDTAKFADIVIQAFGESGNGKIYPTKIVIGANIIDPNTDTYESYEEWWLKDEEAVTKNKNFAIYLKNVALGANSLFMDDIAFDEAGNVVRIKGKDGVYDVGEFTSYKTLLPLVKAFYDYLNSNQYQVGLSVNMGAMSIYGDALVELSDGEDVSSSLFGGRGLKVQGDLTIENGDVTQNIDNKHEISLLYDSNEKADSGLYLTYAHGNFIGTDTKFRGHIQNANMSDMISMILGIANIELSESMMQSWDLEKSTTDFRFLHELLGITNNDVSDEITQVDNILSDVSNIMKMLKNISFEENDNNYSLIVDFDLGDDTASEGTENSQVTDGEATGGSVGKIEILFDKLGKLASISFVLGEDLSATIEIQEFTNFDYDTTASHHNLSSLPEFMDIAVNTLNTKNVNFKGNVSVNIVSVATIELGIDLHISFENGIYAYAEINVKQEGLAFLAVGTYKERISTITLENGVLKLNRWTDKRLGSDENFNKEYVLSDIAGQSAIVQLITDILGLNDLAKGIIKSALENMKIPNPTIEEAIKSFSFDDKKYTLGLNMTNLMGVEVKGENDSDVVYVELGKSKEYLAQVNNSELGQYKKSHVFIESISTFLSIGGYVDINLTLNSHDGDSYSPNRGQYTFYTNDHYRGEYIDNIGSLVA